MIWYTLSCVLSVLPLFVSGQDASCMPTPQCQARNGSCVMDPSECDGFIDSCDCEGINCLCCVPEPSVPSTCSDTTVINDAYGIIQLGSEEELYENNLDCSWVLEPPPGNAVTLTWIRFDVEYNPSCVWDWMQIESAGVIGPKLCGDVIPSPTTTTYCGPVELYFYSDYVVRRPGFAIFYNIAPSNCSTS